MPQNPNPEWPVVVRKVIDGKLDTKYVHNKKELDRYIADPSEGGFGYTTSPIFMEWPKTMSHPRHGMGDILVHNEKDEAKAKKQGYTYEHWDNAQEKKSAAAREALEASATPSFDPSAQHQIKELKAQLKEQAERFEKLMAKLGEKTA